MAKKAAVPNSDLEEAHLKQAKQALEDQGYEVKKKRVFIKKTLDIESEVLREVNIRKAELGNVSLREIIENALWDWLKKNPKP